MGENKNQNCIDPSPHDFRVNLHQNTLWSLWFFGRFWYLLRVELLGWTNFEITDVTARTPEQSFGNFGEILSNSVKESMGRWKLFLGTFLYEGIGRGSNMRTLNPKYARQKSKQIEILKPTGQKCIKETFTIAPMKLQRYYAIELVTLNVWI